MLRTFLAREVSAFHFAGLIQSARFYLPGARTRSPESRGFFKHIRPHYTRGAHAHRHDEAR